MKFFLIPLLLVLTVCGNAAPVPFLDSLKRNVVLAGNPSAKLDALVALLEHHQLMSSDSTWYYALYTKALAARANNAKAKSLATIAEAGAYLGWGHSDTARALIETELARYKVSDTATRDVYFSLALLQVASLGHDDNYKDAMPLLFAIMKDAEYYRDSMVVANCMNTLAAWYYDLDLLPAGRSWGYRALEWCVPGDARFNDLYTGIYIGLGDNYRWVYQLDSAEYFLSRAEKLARRTGNTYWLSVALTRFCGLYIFQKDFTRAEKAIRESLRLAAEIEGDVPQQNKWMFLAAVYERSGRVDEAIRLMNDGLKSDSLYRNRSPHIKKDNGENDLNAINYYSELAKCYQLKGDYKSYSGVLEKIQAGNTAFYKANMANAIAGYQTRYEFEKKEATIARQQLTLVRDRYFLWGTIAISLLTTLVLSLIFRDNRRRHAVRLQLLKEDEKRLALAAVAAAEENERKRIAADLHDNLGAQLSFIKRNVNFIMEQPEGFNRMDEKRYLGYVNDIAGSAMIDLRETLWVLNKDQVTIQEFGDKLKSYLRQQLLDKDHIAWTFEETISVDWTLASGEVMHLFRIVQELVSNSVKHAQPGRIDIRFTSGTTGIYRLEIADNGKGFDVSTANPGHYGLENIRQRAREIGASLTLDSRPGTGTTITVTKEK